MENSEIVECPSTSNQNPVKAIRLKCLDCCAGSSLEVDKCSARKCPIYPFRYGKNPFRTRRELSEDEKERLRAQLAKGRKMQERK